MVVTRPNADHDVTVDQLLADVCAIHDIHCDPFDLATPWSTSPTHFIPRAHSFEILAATILLI